MSKSSKGQPQKGEADATASIGGAMRSGTPPQLHLALRETLAAVENDLNLIASLGIRWSLEALLAKKGKRVGNIERGLDAAVSANCISPEERSLLSKAIMIGDMTDALTLRSAHAVCYRMANAPPVPPNPQRAELFLTRRQNLIAEALLFCRNLIASGESHLGLETKFVAVIGVHKSMFTSMKAGRRPIGDKLAARFESNLGKPQGWLSEVHLSEAMTTEEAEKVWAVLDRYRRIEPQAQARLRALLKVG